MHLGVDEALPRASRIVWIVALAVFVFLVWAYFGKLDEVSSGTGKVVASAKEQVIQSLEGGVLGALYVSEGEIVEVGQELAQLDGTRGESAVSESAGRARAAEATAARLSAEVNGTGLVFPPSVQVDAGLVAAETQLYNARREGLNKALAGLDGAMRLVGNELAVAERQVDGGAGNRAEVLQLRLQLNELQSRYTNTRNTHDIHAREALALANAEVESQRSVTRGREDTLARMRFSSPVRGVVKDIAVTTVGGVVPPNGVLMRIVPIDGGLEVEGRISPRDIAYIHKDQRAMVKVSAYDYSLYGGLEGKVVMISPDTLQDEVHRDVYYYRVVIRTDNNSLVRGDGEPLPITPGMVATVDIHTGQKTVLAYLLKPFNKAREALRER